MWPKALAKLGVREDTIRDNGITGILVVGTQLAIVGAAHLPELLKYHGKDPTTPKSTIIKQVTTFAMKSALQSKIKAANEAKLSFNT